MGRVPGERPALDPNGGIPVTFLWFVVWFIANNIGGSAPLQFDPVNFWAGALLLAIAIDLNRPRPEFGMAKRKPMAQRREAL
jgi:hypothetical protein